MKKEKTKQIEVQIDNRNAISIKTSHSCVEIVSLEPLDVVVSRAEEIIKKIKSNFPGSSSYE